MEKKMKQRILGALVIVGIIIILLPFLQGHDSTKEATLVPPPPFPTPETQTATTSLDETPLTPLVDESNQLTAPAAVSTSNDSKPIDAQPDTSSTAANKPVDNGTANTPTPAAPASDKTVLKKVSVKTSAHPKMIVKNNHHAEHIIAQANASNLQKISNNALFNLKNSAWVIQVGSFSQKTTAVNFVNRLRAKGYHAFYQQVSTTVGDHTRVYIGPESEQHQARVLANKLESDMHLQTLVLSYKPLVS